MQLFKLYVSPTLFAVAVMFATASLSIAQEVEFPPIEGASTQTYREFKIEVVRLRRMAEYQAYFAGTDHARGRRLKPPDNHEVVLIQLRTTRLMPSLGPLTGISVNGVDLISEEGTTFDGNQSRFIGSAKNRLADPTVFEYEFPVIVPISTRFRFAQIRHSIQRESQPYVVTQKIRFVVSDLPH